MLINIFTNNIKLIPSNIYIKLYNYTNISKYKDYDF